MTAIPKDPRPDLPVERGPDDIGVGAWVVEEKYRYLRQYLDAARQVHYLDPPYWQTEGYGVDFPFGEYERMADLMRSAAGRVVLSINDHPEIRRVFDGFTFVPLQVRYTIAREGREAAGELIIKSWDDSQAQLL